MKPILSVVVLILSGLALVADEPKQDATKATATEKELETFVGTWRIVAAQPEGITKEAKKLVFHKDGTYAALDNDDKELWVGTFDLDPTATPKIWDHCLNESRKKGGDTLGIYDDHHLYPRLAVRPLGGPPDAVGELPRRELGRVDCLGPSFRRGARHCRRCRTPVGSAIRSSNSFSPSWKNGAGSLRRRRIDIRWLGASAST